jgi:hypothetical protein
VEALLDGVEGEHLLVDVGVQKLARRHGAPPRFRQVVVEHKEMLGVEPEVADLGHELAFLAGAAEQHAVEDRVITRALARQGRRAHADRQGKKQNGVSETGGSHGWILP